MLREKRADIVHLHGYGATTFGRLCAWRHGHSGDPARARQPRRHAVVSEDRRSDAGAAHRPRDRRVGIDRRVHDARAADAGRAHQGGVPRRAARRVRAAAQRRRDRRGAAGAGDRARHHRHRHHHAADAVEGQPVSCRGRADDPRNSIPSVRIFIVGEGELQRELEAQARALDLGDRLVFSGFMRDVAAALSALDIVVFPSLWEGTPLTVFEALAMGKPIVATDADGLLDVLTDRKDALIVPKADAAALAARSRRADRAAQRWPPASVGEARKTGTALRHRRVRPKDGAALRAAARNFARDAAGRVS